MKNNCVSVHLGQIHNKRCKQTSKPNYHFWRDPSKSWAPCMPPAPIATKGAGKPPKPLLQPYLDIPLPLPWLVSTVWDQDKNPGLLVPIPGMDSFMWSRVGSAWWQMVEQDRKAGQRAQSPNNSNLFGGVFYHSCILWWNALSEHNFNTFCTLSLISIAMYEFRLDGYLMQIRIA